jgi:hypothetical protein
MPHVRICAGGAGQPAFLPRLKINTYSPPLSYYRDSGARSIEDLGTLLKVLKQGRVSFIKKLAIPL